LSCTSSTFPARDANGPQACFTLPSLIGWEVYVVPHENSVTSWIEGLKAGDGSDVQRLWDRYFERLVRLAAARIPAHTRRSFDQEDVALSAFQSFCDRAIHGQFAELGGRDDLWRLLATITVRKAMETMRSQSRQKRGGGRLLGESALQWSEEEKSGLAELLGREPAPDQVVQFSEDCGRLLETLPEPSLQAVAVRRLEGLSSREIAEELNVSTRTIERKLKVIRAFLSQEAEG
jgi:RNA polymerase sigma factor (sigma-70 family)